MAAVFWNPFSISFFVQLIILVISAGYFLVLLSRALASKKDVIPALSVVALFASLTLYIAGMFLQMSLHPDLVSAVYPWIPIPGLLSLISFLLLAYTYPRQIIRWKSLEAFIVTFSTTVLVALEVWIAIQRFLWQLDGYIEYRPAWMDLPWAATVALIVITFFRQYLIELKSAEANAPRPARAFLIISLSPALLLAIISLSSFHLLDGVVREIANCWIMLIIVTSFALTYLNYAPERSSFMVKIAGVSLTIVLGVISTVSWLIGPIYASAYDNERLVREGTALRYSPNSVGGYDVHRTAYHFDENLGDQVDGYARFDLPFSFPFFEDAQKTAFLHPAGFLTFSDYIYLREAGDRFGIQPGIFPLVSDLLNIAPGEGEAAGGPGTYLRQGQDQTIVTWYRMHPAGSEQERYTFQLRLYPRGIIETHFVDLPDDTNREGHLGGGGPQFLGISPGWRAGTVDRIDFQSELPFSSKNNVGLIDDYRLDYLDYLNEIYRPVALFIIAISALILIGLPFFLRINLITPLQRLLEGVERYKSGRFSGPISVSYQDEIGFITEAFNGLAKKQNELINTLEEQVAERTAAAAKLAAENARLAERNHLSGELHDAVSQTLFSSSLLADSLPELIKKKPDILERELLQLRILNRNALAEMRTLLMELRPGRITDAQFGNILKELLTSRQTGGKVEVDLDIENDCKLPGPVQITFYRFAQESLNNIEKHSGASRVAVYFDGVGDQALLSVTDNGRGFDQNAVAEGHLGLQFMKQRIEKIGGFLELESELGMGTKLTLIWAGT